MCPVRSRQIAGDSGTASERRPSWRASNSSAREKSSIPAAIRPSRSKSYSMTAPRAGLRCPRVRRPGAFEAVELRDGEARYGGKGVSKAVLGVIDQLGPELIGYEASEQRLVDQAMLDLDGTDNKSKIGANAILGVSLAVAHAAAHSADLPLYRYVGGPNAHLLPVPMMNIVNGGAHADSDVDVQEFMIAPIGAATFRDALEMGATVYQSLKSVLKKQGLATGLGDEGGFAPNLPANVAALELISTAVESAGLTVGTDVAMALDVASTEFFDNGIYRFEGRELTSDEMTDIYTQWIDDFPIVSIEDPLAEDDWAGWSALVGKIGDKSR